MLPPHLIQDVLYHLKDKFGLSPEAEVSMEADPGTFDLGRIKGYQGVGVQRFSVGVQAFDEVTCPKPYRTSVSPQMLMP